LAPSVISERSSGSAAKASASALLLTLAACASSSAHGGPPSLALSGRATLERYLEALPRQLKMHHQVETRLGTHREVVEGFCVLERPERFWVRATTPLGGTLFDLKTTADGHVTLDTPMESIADARGPFYLARDIRRVYLRDCPREAEIRAVRDGFRISCHLDTAAEAGREQGGSVLADDAMAETVGPGGVVWEKEFYRDGNATAVVHYDDYRMVGDLWLAHRVTVLGRDAPYSLLVVLLSADPAFDAARVFVDPPATAP
jgi:hypothetical protein